MRTRHDVARRLTNLIDASGKTQREIAHEAGFASQNIISMIKSGDTKVPLNRVPALAKALGVEPQELFVECLEAYEPELFDVYAACAPAMLVTTRQVKMIRLLSRAARAGVLS